MVFSLEFRIPNDLGYTGGQLFGEQGALDGVFNSTLGISCNEAYAQIRRIVERVRNSDFAWLQAILVDNMLLRSQNKPKRAVTIDNSIILLAICITIFSGKKVFLFRFTSRTRVFLWLSFGVGLYMLQERSRSARDLENGISIAEHDAEISNFEEKSTKVRILQSTHLLIVELVR